MHPAKYPPLISYCAICANWNSNSWLDSSARWSSPERLGGASTAKTFW